jgi:hypothetical protein
MIQFSGSKIPQDRTEKHRKRTNRFKVWIALFILATLVMLLSLQSTDRSWQCTIPIMLGFGALVLKDGIELYLHTPERELSPQVFEQELIWLFGDDWQGVAGTQEYMLAQDRIQRRQDGREQFYLHLFVSLILTSYFLSILFTPPNYGLPDSLVVFAVPVGLLIIHGYTVFPTRRRLERRERDIGRAIQAEIDRSVPEISKYKEKPKRDVRYRIGEDGELEEIPEDFEGEKPKHSNLL